MSQLQQLPYQEPSSSVQPEIYQQATSTTASSVTPPVRKPKQPWKSWQFVVFSLFVSLVIVLIRPTVSGHAATSQNNWVQAGFNRQRQGYNPFETTISMSNVSQLRVAWSLYTSGSPIENAGILYFSDVFTENLMAVNAANGAILWTAPYRGSINAPAFANGLVYSVLGSTLYALNAANGVQKWSITVGTGFASAPLWANGIIYLGSLDHHLYAFNATTGKIVWSYLTSGQITTPASTDNGNVYVDGGGTLYALNGKTGKLVWGYAAQGSPVIANGLVFVGTNEVIALNETTGKLAWTYANPYGANVSSVASANGDIFFSDTNGALHALTATTGKSLWSYEDTSGTLSVYSTPVIANGVVYAGGYIYNEHAALMAFGEATGALLWYDFDENSYDQGDSPIVVNGMLFFGNTDDDTLWAYHPSGS